LALVSAGKSKLAKIAMIAMTSRSSMSVKPAVRIAVPPRLNAFAG